MQGFAGKVAVVTGAGSGIGQALAVELGRSGASLAISDVNIEGLAQSVPSSDGVVFVPALAGLGAPHWDPDARGTISGITRGTKSAHLARATLEGIAFEVRDLLDAMVKDAKRPLARLRVDGGASENALLMQFQSDIAAVIVERAADLESTGRGAALLAGLGAGLYRSLDDVVLGPSTRFQPRMSAADRDAHLARWSAALARTRSR